LSTTPTTLPAAHLRVLTGTLALFAAASIVALAVDTGAGDAPPVSLPPVTTTQPAAAAPAAPERTSPPTTATTSSTTTTSTTVVSAGEGASLSREEISDTIAGSVGFVTTGNGTGSGVLVGDHTLITNAHVVWPFDRARVLFPGLPSRRAARVVAMDAFADIAVLEIEGRSPLPEPLALGAADDLSPGDLLFVVGYPEPEDFGPEVNVVETSLSRIHDWPYSGMRWIETPSPAIGGQSGGGIVNDRGEVVGITTFGSSDALYSSVMEDVSAVVQRIEGSEPRAGASYRAFPRTGGRWSGEVELDGPWAQALYATWLNGGTTTTLTASPGVEIAGIDIGLGRIASGVGSAEITWHGMLPGFVAVEAPGRGVVEWSSNHPLILLEDPDDGRVVEAGEPLIGIFDLPGDRDFYYFEVTEAGGAYEVAASMRSRSLLAVFDPDGRVVARHREPQGFFFGDPELVFDAAAAGTYVITLQELGGEVSPYELVVR